MKFQALSTNYFQESVSTILIKQIGILSHFMICHTNKIHCIFTQFLLYKWKHLNIGYMMRKSYNKSPGK
jgi:hypothetical protein